MNDVGVLMGGDVNATAEQMKMVLDLESSIAEVMTLFVYFLNFLKKYVRTVSCMAIYFCLSSVVAKGLHVHVLPLDLDHHTERRASR